MAYATGIADAIARLDSHNALLDAGVANAPAVYKVYDGAVPANARTALGAQNLLVTAACSEPAWQAGTDAGLGLGATSTANAIAQVVIAASGLATFYRKEDSDGAIIGQGVVGAEMILNDANLVELGFFTITSAITTQPEI